MKTGEVNIIFEVVLDESDIHLDLPIEGRKDVTEAENTSNLMFGTTYVGLTLKAYIDLSKSIIILFDH